MTTTDKGAAGGSARVTEAELAEVERLDREATPGPWEDVGTRVEYGMWSVGIQTAGRWADATGTDEALMAQARTSLPRLAAEVRRLTAVAEQIARLAVESDATEAALRAQIEALTSELAERAEHADALDDVLARIVAAWRDDEIGAIDGALIEEAEGLLGITPKADPLAAGPAEDAES